MKPKNLLWQETAVTLPAIAVATIIVLSFPFLRGEGMYFLYLTAIVCSSLYGSFRAGVVAAFLSLLLCLLISNEFRDSPNRLMEWLVLIAFGLASGLTVFLCYAQKKSEQARLAAENRYRTLFENAITGIYETTFDGRYLNANPKLAEIFGFDSAHELLTKAENLNDKFYVEPKRHDEFIRLIEKQNTVAGFESEIFRRDGTKIWISENALAVRDDDDKLIGFQGTTIDITIRKKAEAEVQQAKDELEKKVAERTVDLEQANKILRDEIAERMRIEKELRQSEEKFRALVEVSSEMIWEVDENTDYTYVSPKSQEFNGYEPHEIIGNKPFMLMPPEEAKRVAKIFKEIGEKGETFYFLETITIKKDGEVTISETSGTPFFDDAGNFRGYRGVARDVTEQRRADRFLAESEKRYRELVENAQDVIFTEDLEGNYVSVNRRGLELFGYAEEQVKNLKLIDIVAPEYLEIAVQMREAKLNGEYLTVYEIDVLTREGNRVPVEVSSWIIYDENGAPVGVHGIARDITERRRAERELHFSERRLRDLSAHLLSVREDERKNLARELHDELGQILTALKIDLVRLAEKLSGTNKTSRIFEIKEKPLQMIALVDSAMDTTRKIVAELRPGVLDELGLSAAVEWQTLEFQKRTGIECRLKIEFSENATCINHKTAVFRIFQECLTNIVRHSGATEVRILLRNERVSLVLEVEDNGRGITEQETGNPHKFGILGMRERTVLLDGTFDISNVSETGGGTRIKVSIPCPPEGVK